MRQKRAKAYRKLMELYAMSFGFRQPYQVLVDSEMCKSAINLKLELVKQLGLVLQGSVKPMITQCCIHELYLQGATQQAAVNLAKTFERRRCNHKEPIPGDACLANMVGDSNKHRYVIATQSQPLRSQLRRIPAVPMVHVNRSVMVLEPPSDVTIKTKEAAEEQALHPTGSDMALVSSTTIPEPPRKRRKGPKGPNPLSIKKRKVKANIQVPNEKGKHREILPKNDMKATRLSHETNVGVKRKREVITDIRDERSGEVVGERKRKKRRSTVNTTAVADP